MFFSKGRNIAPESEVLARSTQQEEAEVAVDGDYYLTAWCATITGGRWGVKLNIPNIVNLIVLINAEGIILTYSGGGRYR